MKILTLSDTHGYPFKKIKKMLDKAKFCEKDFLYVLGDTIDRGNGHDMLHFLRFILAHPNNVELIIGNHERMALDNVCLFEEPCKHMSELSVLEKNVIVFGWRMAENRHWKCSRGLILQN